MNRIVRVISVFVILLCWLGGHALSLEHALESAHSYCEEHHQLEDVESHQSFDSHDDGDASQGVLLTNLGDTNDNEAPEHHDACEFAKVFECKNALLLDNPTIDAHWLEFEQRRAFALESDATRQGVWLLAPKTSPPSHV